MVFCGVLLRQELGSLYVYEIEFDECDQLHHHYLRTRFYIVLSHLSRSTAAGSRLGDAGCGDGGCKTLLTWQVGSLLEIAHRHECLRKAGQGAHCCSIQ